MNKLVICAFIAIIFPANASAKTAPYYECRWQTSSETTVSVTAKVNGAEPQNSKTSSNKLNVRICPDSKRTGWNFALVLPIGLAVGHSPVKVNADGSITATLGERPDAVSYMLRGDQKQLTGTLQKLPDEKNPNPPSIPISFVRTGKC